MSGRKGTKAMTGSDYNKIRALIGYGLKNVQIAQIVGRSSSTVSRARHAETYEDYVANVKQLRKDWVAKRTKIAVPELNVVKLDRFDEIRDRDTPKLYMTTITNYRSTVFGLGSDNKLYTWSRPNQSWEVDR